jgi:hypothetical protein
MARLLDNEFNKAVEEQKLIETPLPKNNSSSKYCKSLESHIRSLKLLFFLSISINVLNNLQSETEGSQKHKEFAVTVRR